MRRFCIFLCVLNFILGCRSDAVLNDGKKINNDKEAFSTFELIPFFRSSVSRAYHDLESLVSFFKFLVDNEYINSGLSKSSISVIDQYSKYIVKELSCYGKMSTIQKGYLEFDTYCGGVNKSHNIYMVLGYDLDCINALREILHTLNVGLTFVDIPLSKRNIDNVDVRIASLLLFNLEQLAYHIDFVVNIFSDEVLEKIKMNNEITVENVSSITNVLLLFMQLRDELIVDFKNVINSAAKLKRYRRLMEAELGKIIKDGKIKKKIADSADFAKTIQELVIAIVKDLPKVDMYINARRI
ncbi:hypothetical protein [Borrelia hispanica]|uniref:hypothetical protein n=1 Tax=Borrelia hispanica TaxID=40835 RepID=UPI0004648A56|nr:hypothetical protein [Borrelia hispanica]